MSGFVAILDLQERPVDRPLLNRLTDYLSARGPDAQATWSEGPAGLGFALLSACEDTLDQHQPRSLDGGVWLAGHVRLDGREELTRRLEERGVKLAGNTSDAELVLHAYTTWGEKCVEQLLGDFTFVLWDRHARRLFGARDHFGVKPFFFAQVAGCLLVSNTLACLRLHPAVSGRLNELAIGDFLALGHNCDLTTTTFADIQRLPAAHALRCVEGRLQTWRYWELPCDGEIRYPHAEDYIEHFRHLLQTAVTDRLRHRNVGILMSGGLDSTAVAALAREQATSESTDLHAYTVVYDRIIPDTERHFASLAAEALGLPIHYFVADDYAAPFVPGASGVPPTAEPLDDPQPALLADHFAQVAARSRVLLTGIGGDPLMTGSPAYMMNHLTRFRWPRWLAETVGYAWPRRRLPPLGLRATLKRWVGWRGPRNSFPSWVAPEFARRLGLRRRFDALVAGSPPQHPSHPEAYEDLSSPFWPTFFEGYDPGVTGRAVDVRHPFFDVRLVSFVLAIPPLPWCADKEILRTAMRGLLPEVIRLRPKTPLAGDPLVERFRQTKTCWANFLDAKPELAWYVNMAKLESLVRSTAAAVQYHPLRLTRPLCLSFWLEHPGPVPISVREGKCL